MIMARGLLLVALAFAALALPAAASPPVSTRFNIIGYEYAFTSKVGSFAGTGSGNAGGAVYWNATVKHDPLGSDPAYVNGGPFAMTVRGPGSLVDAVVGTFSHRGGKITTLDRGANCTNQKYLVSSTLKAVSTPATSGGAGKFEVTLTHFRHRFLGRCIAYKARVSGSVRFSY